MVKKAAVVDGTSENVGTVFAVEGAESVWGAEILPLDTAQRGLDHPEKQRHGPPNHEHRPCPLQFRTSSHLNEQLTMYVPSVQDIHSFPEELPMHEHE